MAVIRVHKTKDYTVMSNAHFREKEMTLKAKGLLSLMLSLPDDWNYSIAGLVAICVEKESAIVSTLKELKKFGYLRIDKLMPNETESGRIEYVYNVFERPQAAEVYEIQGAKKQGVENQGLEFQGVENQGQLSIYKSNTDKSNTEKVKEKEERKKGSFDTLIDEYCSTIDPRNADEVKGLLKDWLKVRKAKRAAMTDRAIQLNLEKLNEVAAESNMTIANYLEAVIMRGWQAFYPIKEYGAGASKPQPSSNNPFLDIAKEEGII